MLGIELQRSGGAALSRQIYRTLCEQISSGRIAAGDTLPSTRELARDLAVSRNTVSEAYEMLSAEGYISSHQGSPTRVSAGIHMESPFVYQTAPSGNDTITDHIPPKDCLMFRRNNSGIEADSGIYEDAGNDMDPDNRENPENRENPRFPIVADFHTGQPDLRHFARFQWNQIMRKAMEDLPLSQFGYTGPDGFPDLRTEISCWLFRSRGLAVTASDIFITAGATSALHLIADLLCQDGRGIIMEDPCHMGMLRVLKSKQYPVYPVPVDDHGFQTSLLEMNNASAVYVTPSHQFPLGSILPAARRTALIRYARENDVYIIEDDYDSEFRYAGEPVAPLFSMDPNRVIYVGTFSKTLFPALRIGYVILPAPLQATWRYLRTHTDVQNPPFEQAALAQFLHSRKMDRHIHKMRRLYGERRRQLFAALSQAFGSDWRPLGDAAGLHVAVEFPGKYFGKEFSRICRENGILITPVEYHSIQKGIHTDKLLLGYGHLEPEEINLGIQLLKKVIDGLK